MNTEITLTDLTNLIKKVSTDKKLYYIEVHENGLLALCNSRCEVLCKSMSLDVISRYIDDIKGV